MLYLRVDVDLRFEVLTLDEFRRYEACGDDRLFRIDGDVVHGSYDTCDGQPLQWKTQDEQLV